MVAKKTEGNWGLRKEMEEEGSREMEKTGTKETEERVEENERGGTKRITKKEER